MAYSEEKSCASLGTTISAGIAGFLGKFTPYCCWVLAALGDSRREIKGLGSNFPEVILGGWFRLELLSKSQ